MKKIKICLLSLVATLVIGCSPDLEFVDNSDINPNIFPVSEADIESLVVSAYYPLRGAYTKDGDHNATLEADDLNTGGIHHTAETGLIFLLDATTEILQTPFQGTGGIQGIQTFHSYAPNTASEGITKIYDLFYNDISNMTLSIDLIENSSVNETIKKEGIAEIKCARGLLAYELFDMYGPIVVAPLDALKEPLVEVPLARLSNDEMVSFIEQNLLDAIEDLPLPADAEYGRFSQGLARMILIRLYLHQKRWSDVKEQANAIIAMGYYQLEPDYLSLFAANETVNSKEPIWIIPVAPGEASVSQWHQTVLPPEYPSQYDTFGIIQSSWQFYESFEATDVRKTNFITEFVTTGGETINKANPKNRMNRGPVPLKIALDEDRSTSLTSIDMIIYRYADVLLSKAEALANETGTPTQEAIDLVNLVRERAQIPPVLLADYADIETFNTMILLERSHEYWCENGQYRSDLIRHGKYTEYADALNGAASESAPHKVVFPFSNDRISEGKGEFKQNPGYL